MFIISDCCVHLHNGILHSYKKDQGHREHYRKYPNIMLSENKQVIEHYICYFPFSMKECIFSKEKILIIHLYFYFKNTEGSTWKLKK